MGICKRISVEIDITKIGILVPNCVLLTILKYGKFVVFLLEYLGENEALFESHEPKPLYRELWGEKK
jgi:hypothetical protein